MKHLIALQSVVNKLGRDIGLINKTIFALNLYIQLNTSHTVTTVT